MKTVVSVQEVQEYDIKPVAALVQWRSLVEQEIGRRWHGRPDWITVACPSCGLDQGKPAFERMGIPYAECPACASLYASQRPNERELWWWYRESEPARFWREQMLPVSESSRREKITLPRSEWILDNIAEYVPDARRLVDVSANGRSLLDLLVNALPDLTEAVSAGMTADLDGRPTARIAVQPSKVADLKGLGPVDVIVAVDALDRSSDLKSLVGAFETILTPGGVLFATVSVASGFEVQALWERSNTISPPDKLNLPTVDGLQQIFSGPAWEILELSTPGMFDVEMVRNVMKQAPDQAWPRLLRSLVERTDAAGRMALVEFLQSRRLASFARLIVRRRR